MPLENKSTKELAICNVDKAGVLAKQYPFISSEKTRRQIQRI